MGIRAIVKYGDECLRKVCKEVKVFDEKLGILLDDMAQTMYKAGGVGLAANQVGILKSVVVIDVSNDRSQLIELVNPVIVKTEGSVVDEEGCLSIDGEKKCIARPQTVEVKACDRHGKEFTITGKDYLARALCHEIDHLKGVMFIDYPEAIGE